MSNTVEGKNFRDVVRFEDDSAGRISREVVTVLSGQDLAVGDVVGKIALGTCPVTGTPCSPITGAGEMNSVTAGAKAKTGTYTVKCIHAVVGGGIFSVEDPDGEALPNAVVGAYVSDQINFTITDSSPDWAVDDYFTVTIAEGSGSVKAIDKDGVDGSQDAYGILTADCDATDAAKQAVVIVKDAVIVAANLGWPVTSPVWTAGQKAAALAQLAAKGIVARDEA